LRQHWGWTRTVPLRRHQGNIGRFSCKQGGRYISLIKHECLENGNASLHPMQCISK
jgi:hypothetical protein